MQDYKCAEVTICATMVDSKLDLYVLTPVAVNNKPKQKCTCYLVLTRQLQFWWP